MRMLFVSSSSGSRGGGELYLVNLGRILASQNVEVHLWASGHPRMDELCGKFNEFGTAHRANYVNSYDKWTRGLAPTRANTAAALSDQWRRIQPDFIHINKQNLEDGLDLLAAGALLEAPQLCLIHITQTAAEVRARFPALRDFRARSAVRNYPGTLVAVQRTRAAALDTFLRQPGRTKVLVAGTPALTKDFVSMRRPLVRQRLDLPSDAPLTVGVGRMVQQKRPGLFIDRAVEILKRVPDARFLWLGDGPLSSEWDERVARLGLARQIIRLPWSQDVPSFLAAADLFLHTAEYEGLPLALLEALGAGLPCAIPETLLQEAPELKDTVVSSDNTERLAGILLDRTRLEALAAGSRRLHAEHYSLPRMASDYLALCRDVASQKSEPCIGAG